jgi:hypothetical protein
MTIAIAITTLIKWNAFFREWTIEKMSKENENLKNLILVAYSAQFG